MVSSYNHANMQNEKIIFFFFILSYFCISHACIRCKVVKRFHLLSLEANVLSFMLGDKEGK